MDIQPAVRLAWWIGQIRCCDGFPERRPHHSSPVPAPEALQQRCCPTAGVAREPDCQHTVAGSDGVSSYWIGAILPRGRFQVFAAPALAVHSSFGGLGSCPTSNMPHHVDEGQAGRSVRWQTCGMLPFNVADRRSCPPCALHGILRAGTSGATHAAGWQAEACV